jgi:hypothetical protein
MKQTNKIESRETWLREATKMIRPHFESCGFSIPENIRFAIAFPSTGRKGNRVGELWHATTSEDGNYELIIRADISDPIQVMGVLTHELVHAVLPIDAGHGKLYKAAAIKLGLQGKMTHAMPSPLLIPRLAEIVEALSPLPHARLDIGRGATDRGPADRPKKQGTRMLKATCEDSSCGYTVRLTAKWVLEVGAPLCPKHGVMAVDLPADEIEEAAEAERESV